MAKKAALSVKDATWKFLHDLGEPLSDNDTKLVTLAKAQIGLLYEHGWHQLFAAAVDAEGNTFTGLQLDEPAGDASIGAEPLAIHEAAKQKRVIKTIVAVRRQRPDEGIDSHVVSPCGRCRIRLMHHNPELFVIIWLGGKYNCLRKVPIAALYPAPTKQRKRTENGIAGHDFQR